MELVARGPSEIHAFTGSLPHQKAPGGFPGCFTFFQQVRPSVLAVAALVCEDQWVALLSVPGTGRILVQSSDIVDATATWREKIRRLSMYARRPHQMPVVTKRSCPRKNKQECPSLTPPTAEMWCDSEASVCSVFYTMVPRCSDNTTTPPSLPPHLLNEDITKIVFAELWRTLSSLFNLSDTFLYVSLILSKSSSCLSWLHAV